MARKALTDRGFRYTPILSYQNRLIADWVVHLTHNQRNRGFNLCFLLPRNLKGYGSKKKRAFRIRAKRERNPRRKPGGDKKCAMMH